MRDTKYCLSTFKPEIYFFYQNLQKIITLVVEGTIRGSFGGRSLSLKIDYPSKIKINGHETNELV